MSVEHFSVSQLKTYIKSKQQWSGKYILWFQDTYKPDARELWVMFHKRAEDVDWSTDEILQEKIAKKCISTLKKKYDADFVIRAKEPFEILRQHFSYYDDSGITQREKKLVENFETPSWKTIGFVWYIDAIHKDWYLVDYKSVTYLTKMWDTNIPMRAWMPVWKEYEMQAWLYMMFTGLKEARFVEFLKKDYKKYWPEQWHQILKFKRSAKRHKDMLRDFMPIIEEMVAHYERFEVVIDNYR